MLHEHKKEDWPRRAELLLRDALKSNSAAGFRASENKVIERLLDAEVAMRGAWEEVGKKLDNVRLFSRVLEIIVSTAASHPQIKIDAHREALRRALELNIEIAQTARALADLLDKQFALKEKQNISLRVSNDPVDCMNRWAQLVGEESTTVTQHRAHLFRSDVAPALAALQRQYDGRYWPTVSDLLKGMESAADEAFAESYDPLCLAALESRQSSPHDFSRALVAAIDVAKKYDGMPAEFRFSIATHTAIMHCALGLPEDSCTEESVKKALQRIDKGTSSG